jgi:hypothetical protein
VQTFRNAKRCVDVQRDLPAHSAKPTIDFSEFSRKPTSASSQTQRNTQFLFSPVIRAKSNEGADYFASDQITREISMAS